MDNELTMERQVNTVCKACYLQLRSIQHIRPYITKDAAQILVHSLITSRLDYCNSLLLGIPEHLIEKLQKNQNHAAKVIFNRRKYDHVSDILQDLHWLKVKERIEFKVLLFIYKALSKSTPPYIQELIQRNQPKRTLLSQRELIEPRANLNIMWLQGI